MRTKERHKSLIDQLPEEQAALVERILKSALAPGKPNLPKA